MEMVQVKHGQSPEIFSHVLPETIQQYNFRQSRDFRLRSVKSVHHGSESTS